MDWQTGLTYRVGEELAEAHFAELNGFMGCVSVPSLAVCMGLDVVAVLSWWGVREDVSFALGGGELSSEQLAVEFNRILRRARAFPRDAWPWRVMELLPTTTTTNRSYTDTARITCGQRVRWSLL